MALSQQQRAEDVLLLAKAYYQGRDYRRAVHTLERHGLLGFKVCATWVGCSHNFKHTHLIELMGNPQSHYLNRSGFARAPDAAAAAPPLHAHGREQRERGLLVGAGGLLSRGAVPGGVGPVSFFRPRPIPLCEPNKLNPLLPSHHHTRYEECLQLLEQIMPWDDAHDDDAAGDDPDGFGAQLHMPSSEDLQEIRAAILLAAEQLQQRQQQAVAPAKAKAKAGAAAAAAPAAAPATRARRKVTTETWGKAARISQQHQQQPQQQEQGAGEADGDDVARSVLGTLAALCCLRAQIYEVCVRLCAPPFYHAVQLKTIILIRQTPTSRRTTARGPWPGASTRCAWTCTAWRRSSSWSSGSCSGRRWLWWWLDTPACHVNPY